MVLVFAHIAGSLPGLMGAIRNETVPDSALEYDSKLALKIYSTIGVTAITLQVIYLPNMFSPITACLYAVIIGITRECTWKKKGESDPEALHVTV